MGHNLAFKGLMYLLYFIPDVKDEVLIFVRRPERNYFEE